MNAIENAIKALELYRDGFTFNPKRTRTGVDLSEWKPNEKLLDDCGNAARVALPGLIAMREGAGAIEEIAAERRRQIETEDFTASHDNMATRGQLAAAAACYAVAGIGHAAGDRVIEKIWPWDKEWWKPTVTRRNLIKAGALIAAEIDRLDRIDPPSQEPHHASDCAVHSAPGMPLVPADDRAATLTMELRADSGYAMTFTSRVSANQWASLLVVADGAPRSRAAIDAALGNTPPSQEG